MKTLRAMFSLALIVCLLTAANAADDAQKKKQDNKGTRGVIEKVDGDAKTISIKTGKKKDPNAATVIINVTNDTKYTLSTADGDKNGTFADLIVGKRVMIQKETKDGKEVATSVTIMDKKKKKT